MLYIYDKLEFVKQSWKEIKSGLAVSPRLVESHKNVTFTKNKAKKLSRYVTLI